MGFEHYRYLGKSESSRESLENIVAARKAKEAAENAERQRVSRLRHKANMEGFRAWVHRQDHLTDEEKASMIKASFAW